jgi:hypothetical protein
MMLSEHNRSSLEVALQNLSKQAEIAAQATRLGDEAVTKTELRLLFARLIDVADVCEMIRIGRGGK